MEEIPRPKRLIHAVAMRRPLGFAYGVGIGGLGSTLTNLARRADAESAPGRSGEPHRLDRIKTCRSNVFEETAQAARMGTTGRWSAPCRATSASGASPRMLPRSKCPSTTLTILSRCGLKMSVGSRDGTPVAVDEKRAYLNALVVPSAAQGSVPPAGATGPRPGPTANAARAPYKAALLAGINGGISETILGGWCVGTVLDSAASRSVIGSQVRISPSSMAINVNVNVEWWTGDKLFKNFMDKDGLVYRRNQPAEEHADRAQGYECGRGWRAGLVRGWLGQRRAPQARRRSQAPSL